MRPAADSLRAGRAHRDRAVCAGRAPAGDAAALLAARQWAQVAPVFFYCYCHQRHIDMYYRLKCYMGFC